MWGSHSLVKKKSHSGYFFFDREGFISHSIFCILYFDVNRERNNVITIIIIFLLLSISFIRHQKQNSTKYKAKLRTIKPKQNSRPIPQKQT